MRRSRTVLITLIAVVPLLLGSVSYAAKDRGKPVQPKLGIWEASPKGVSEYSLGGWTLSRTGGHLHMTAHPDWGGIYEPNAGKCTAGILNPALSKADYRLGSKGHFRITDHEANQTKKGKPLVQHVVWTGTFTAKHKVSGKVSIWMTKAPPAAHPGAKPTVVCRDMKRAWTGGTA